MAATLLASMNGTQSSTPSQRIPSLYRAPPSPQGRRVQETISRSSCVQKNRKIKSSFVLINSQRRAGRPRWPHMTVTCTLVVCDQVYTTHTHMHSLLLPQTQHYYHTALSHPTSPLPQRRNKKVYLCVQQSVQSTFLWISCIVKGKGRCRG